MLNKDQIGNRKEVRIIYIEDLVAKEHILRDIDRAIDFRFIYDEVKDLYCKDIGRPSVDTVVLIKIVQIQYTFSIRSMRQQ